MSECNAYFIFGTIYHFAIIKVLFLRKQSWPNMHLKPKEHKGPRGPKGPKGLKGPNGPKVVSQATLGKF